MSCHLGFGVAFDESIRAKYFLSSFVFKNEIEKGGLPRGSPAGVGAHTSTPTTPPITSNY
jgi:hypothetical protein